MRYLFIPKEIFAEKLSHLKIIMDGLSKYPDGSIGADFRDLFKIHYNDLKELKGYTLPPPGVRITNGSETE